MGCEKIMQLEREVDTLREGLANLALRVTKGTAVQTENNTDCGNIHLPRNPDINRICLIGKMRSGKDTLGSILYGKHGYTRYAFGDELKSVYHKMFGPKEKNLRQAYQWFGQTMREHDKDIWARKTFDKIDYDIRWFKEESQNARMVVTDCRQPNEYTGCVDRNFLIVRVVCDEGIRIARMRKAGYRPTEAELNHETETALDSYPVHFVVDNSRTVTDLIEDFTTQLTLWRGECERDKRNGTG